jgi:predicted secreted Zn-dependent protease
VARNSGNGTVVVLLLVMVLLLVGIGLMLQAMPDLVTLPRFLRIPSAARATPTPHAEGACADVRADVRRATYTVHGDTGEELRAHMDAHGPTCRTSEHYDACTEWQTTWRYRYRDTAEGCAVQNVEVRTYVTITLPAWSPPAHAPQDLVQRWNGYLDVLDAHEEGHRDIAVAAGQTMGRALCTIPAQDSCAALEAALDAAARRAMQQANAQSAAYDERTDHGAHQGATFP